MQPQITTVIPTYRRPQLLARAIRSVLAQSYPYFEIHVYDNASGDETPELAAEFAERDPRVKYHCHPRNIGMMENFAYGISHVETPFFNILSDDDFLLPGFFEHAIRVLEGDAGLGFFIGGLLFHESGRVVMATTRRWRREGKLKPPELLRGMYPGAWLSWTSTVFRASAVRMAGGLKPELGYAADVELMARLAASNPAYVSKNPSAALTLHAGSASIANEASQYTARSSLEIGDSICNAIDRAKCEGTLDPSQAESMRDLIKGGLDWRLLRRRLILVGQGRDAAAEDFAKAMRAASHRPLLVRLTDTALSTNALAFTLRALRRIRSNVRDRVRRRRFAVYSELILSTIRALERTTLQVDQTRPACDGCWVPSTVSRNCLEDRRISGVEDEEVG